MQTEVKIELIGNQTQVTCVFKVELYLGVVGSKVVCLFHPQSQNT